jgi:UDP-N-acetylmuramoyl-tripeptide--D-alanyl-D-alanine ligase
MVIKSLIYILQSENYDLKRFLKFVYSNWNWFSLEKRKKIVWTAKVKLIFGLTSLIFLSLLVLSFFHLKAYLLIAFLLLVILLPEIIILAYFLVIPIDFILKTFILKKASNILAALDLTVIGITGSYGKTSMKEILSTVLGQKFRVINTPGNVNTDLGIANYIIKNQSQLKKSQVFVVEIGAYRVGEIKKSAQLVKPKYSVLTGINETHLERFGSLKKTIQAKFELIENSAKKAFLNFDDQNIKKNHQKFIFKNGNNRNKDAKENKKDLNQGLKIIKISKNLASDIKVLKEFQGLVFTYENLRFKTKLLAKHNITFILIAIKIARSLSMKIEEIQRGVKKIDYIKHRLEPIFNKNTGVTVIDDSYNANFNGIKSGLQVLNRAPGRKVVLTPGVVELGDKKEEIHKKIANLYSQNVDLVLLIKNSQTDIILKEFQKNNFKNYKIYETVEVAHNDLANILQKGDTIIFQNDLGDHYK